MNQESVSNVLHKKLNRIIANAEPDQRLPSEPELAKQLGVSRATLREAMRTFETQGMLRRRQGSGTYVTHPKNIIESGLEVLESIEHIAERIGLPVSFGALEIERRIATNEEASIFNISPDDQVISIARVILLENRPVAYLIDTLPKGIIARGELEKGFTGSILDLLLRRGEPQLTTSRTEINAVPSSSKVSRALDIQRGDVLLSFTADLYTEDGHIINHSHSYFLPGYFRFHVVRKVA
jgi:GntR family transcriptional regulator